MGKQSWKAGNMLNPVPAVMVSVADQNHRPNIITVAWAGTVCTNPPMVSISVRPSRYSYEIIEKTGEFVINLTNEKLAKACDYCGVVSGRDVDKFTTFNDIKRSPNGLLYITKDTNSYMSAFVKQEIDLGTHTLFIAQLVAAETLSDIPTATYTYYQQNIKPKPEKTEKRGWRCKICGFIYEGDDLPADYICPVCKHGAADFERIS